MGKHFFQSVFLFATLGLLAFTGCHKQPKPQPLVPPPMLPQSAMVPLPEALPPSNATPIVTPPPAPVATVTKPKGRPRNPHRISDMKPSVQPPPTNTQPVTPPENGPTPKITAPSRDVPTSAAISEGLPHSDEMHRKETAAQLNQSTEDNLRSITRALTASEQSVVAQIRSFISQSQEAIADNDLVRAHNLALKAHLLSDELARR